MTDDLITPVYNRPTRPPKVKQLTPAVVVAVDRPCDDEDCFESSGGSPDPDSVTDDPPSYRVEEEEENAVAVTESTVTVPSTTTTATTTRSPPTLQQLTTTTASTAWMVTPRPTSRSTVTTTTTSATVTFTRYPPLRTAPTLFPVPPSPATPRIRIRPTPSAENLDKLWERTRNQEREEMERKRDLEEKSKRIRDRINSESAENTAMIIGIVAGALIAVILVVLLVLKLKRGNNPVYKVDERKGNFGGKQTPSQSNSNAALLNTGVVAGQQGGAQQPGNRPVPAGLGSINPVLGKTTNSGKKTGKDIKEWYV